MLVTLLIGYLNFTVFIESCSDFGFLETLESPVTPLCCLQCYLIELKSQVSQKFPPSPLQLCFSFFPACLCVLEAVFNLWTLKEGAKERFRGKLVKEGREDILFPHLPARCWLIALHFLHSSPDLSNYFFFPLVSCHDPQWYFLSEGRILASNLFSHTLSVGFTIYAPCQLLGRILLWRCSISFLSKPMNTVFKNPVSIAFS